MSTTQPVLSVSGLKKHYTSSSGLVDGFLGRSTSIKAVDGVDLEVYPGETVGIVGESGSGKSTLGETILRLEDPTEGRILFQGEDLSSLSDRELRRYRSDIQIIFQDPYESLNPKKTVYQIVSEPLRNFRSMTKDEYRERVADLLFDLGLRPPGQYLDLTPGQMSGGQRQRVNIARALILEPDLLVADEPLAMLDPSIQAGILKKLNDLQDELDFAMIYISHNLSIVKVISDRIFVMYRGKVVETGGTNTIIDDPKHPYTRALLDSLPDLTKDRERVLLPEDPTDETELPDGCSFHPRCPDAMPECSEAVPALVEVEGEREVACYLHHDQALE